MKNCKTKTPSPRRRNRMFCAINLCQNAILQRATKMKPPFLPFDELNLCNDCILWDSEYIDRFCINFSYYCVLNQVDLDTNLLDNVILRKVILRPTTKPRSVGPHKLKSKKTTSKKHHPSKTKNPGFEYTTTWRICSSIQWWEKYTTKTSILHEWRYGELSIHRYWCIDSNLCLKLTKKCSHIISDISIPNCSPQSEHSQRFKIDTDSPSISEKDIELLYPLIERLLFTRKITISDVQTCGTYILTRTGLPTNYQKGWHLNVGTLFVKMVQIFILRYVLAST